MSQRLIQIVEIFHEFALAVVEKRYIIITGGVESPGADTDLVSLFDLREEKWVLTPQMPPLINRRCKHASFAIKQFVFVCSGYRIERLDLGCALSCSAEKPGCVWDSFQIAL